LDAGIGRITGGAVQIAGEAESTRNREEESEKQTRAQGFEGGGPGGGPWPLEETLFH